MTFWGLGPTLSKFNLFSPYIPHIGGKQISVTRLSDESFDLQRENLTESFVARAWKYALMLLLVNVFQVLPLGKSALTALLIPLHGKLPQAWHRLPFADMLLDLAFGLLLNLGLKAMTKFVRRLVPLVRLRSLREQTRLETLLLFDVRFGALLSVWYGGPIRRAICDKLAFDMRLPHEANAAMAMPLAMANSTAEPSPAMLDTSVEARCGPTVFLDSREGIKAAVSPFVGILVSDMAMDCASPRARVGVASVESTAKAHASPHRREKRWTCRRELQAPCRRCCLASECRLRFRWAQCCRLPTLCFSTRCFRSIGVRSARGKRVWRTKYLPTDFSLLLSTHNLHFV